jgi:hypothetical protein
MFKWLQRLSWAVIAAMFLHNLWFFGGVTLIPGVGMRAMTQAQKEMDAIGLLFYAGPGRAMAQAVNANAARDYAVEGLGLDAIREISSGDMRATPRRIMDAMPGKVRFTYHGVPVMIVVLVLLWWFRPKPVRIAGS